MQLIKRGDLRLLLSDEGKHIRSIDDVYVPEHIDEETGELIPEHFPDYSQMIFLGIQVKEKDIPNLYIEEPIDEV
ncbi:MAG: hypothetical protein IIZ67_06260 [Bacilli bacterium]|nr:hypothetical protein [Bacilli bacterium]